MYSGGFIKVFEVYQKCNPSATLATYSGHGWEEDQARNIAAALEFAAQKCKLSAQPGTRPLVVALEGNEFGDVGRRLIKQSVQFGKIFAGVRF